MSAWALRRGRSAPLLLLSLPLLGLARLLPAEGTGLWLRLVAASLVLFIPGALVARALRVRGASATVAWALAALGVALALVFLVHTAIWVALAVLGAIALAALVPALGVVSGPRAWDTVAVSVAGLAFGIALWHVAGVVHGDALFHLARVRKLDAFGDLHLRSVDEFADGGLHPGYAFPLWHGFLALVSKLAGVDPARVMEHEPSAVAPVAFAVAYESGVAVFRSAWLGLGVLGAAVAGAALAPGHGGSYALLGQPGRSAHELVREYWPSRERSTATFWRRPRSQSSSCSCETSPGGSLRRWGRSASRSSSSTRARPSSWRSPSSVSLRPVRCSRGPT